MNGGENVMNHIYLDNAATTQINPQVAEDMLQYEKEGRGNPNRGLHFFAERATTLLEAARTRVSSFIGGNFDELIFTKSTTESLNLAIFNLTRGLAAGDEVVYTIFDHHATLLPLLERSKEQGFALKVIPITEEGELDMQRGRALVNEKTKLVVFPHVSNVTGLILPAKELTELAKSVGALVLIDGAQAVGHMPVNVKEIGCDAYAFGAHKMYGPMGIGALYVEKGELEHWKPLIYGGGMIEEVESRESKVESVKYLSGPRLFEAGTPNVTGAFGFAGACNYVEMIGRKKIMEQEKELSSLLIDGLSKMKKVKVFPSSGSIVSFAVDGMHPHDVSQYLSDKGIAVRAGHHCAAPLSKLLDPAGTVRVSFGATSTQEDVTTLLEALKTL